MSLNQVLSVMIPAFNEERTLDVIMKHVLEQPEVGEVIAVDDGSTDGTWAIMSRFAERDRRVRAFRQEANRGKGAALRRAIAEIRMPFALVQDADLEYDPRDYPTLLRPLVEGRADVVYGVRGFAGQTAFSFWFVIGNKAVTFAACSSTATSQTSRAATKRFERTSGGVSTCKASDLTSSLISPPASCAWAIGSTRCRSGTTRAAGPRVRS